MKLHTTYLCERNALVREGIKGFLSSSPFQVIGEYCDVSEIPAPAEENVPHLIILGIDQQSRADAHNQRHLELLTGITRLRQHYANVRLVLLLSGQDLNCTRDALCWAADSCVLRETSQDAFLHYLNLAMVGEKVFPASMVAYREKENGREAVLPVRERGALSERERDIIRCLIRGDSNKMIAHRLSIAEATVKAHLKAILRKLGVSNRTQAALWGVSQGLDAEHATPIARAHEPAA
jgi:two-component system nitrate/nitrite response regulator NarL